MTPDATRLRIKTSICATVVVLSNVFGNFFMKRGMPAELPTPLSYITALFQPWVSLGVLLLILWMLSRMALLSWADLSYVLPVTSIGYVLVALAGRVLLHEQISAKRWAGIALIVSGVALVSGGSAPQTAKDAPLPHGRGSDELESRPDELPRRSDERATRSDQTRDDQTRDDQSRDREGAVRTARAGR